VLDPFAGSGTTLAVADALGLESLGIEAQPAYVELMPGRFADVARRLAAGSAPPKLDAIRPQTLSDADHGPLFALTHGDTTR